MQMYDLPDPRGHFGPYGGVFVAETLIHALEELRDQYARYQHDPEFVAEFEDELAHYVGRPSPVYHARRLSEQAGGAQIWLKREDLNHTGAHKINNCIGQALLARRLGKRRVIAETGAGQHGVATATVAARFGMECVVYMGSEDIRRQAQNVFRMKLLGASVVPVESGSKTLKDALNEAMRDWVTNVETTFYIIGTVAGPHPYPMMVRDFQSVIGKECLVQMPRAAGRQPDAVIACVGGGSNAMGIFHPYIAHPERPADRRRGGGRGHRHRAALGVADRGAARRAARQPHLPAAGRERPDHRDALGVGRPRLSGRGSRARVAEGQRPRRVRVDHRRRGDRGVPPVLPDRGHHPGARVLARAGVRLEARRHDGEGPHPAREPLGARRQGHEHRRRALRIEVLLPARMRSRVPGMNRIDQVFARLRAAGRTALIPYVTTGDPSPALTVPIMHRLVAAGADIIELGVPFSDPMADGPVIQRASERALAQGVGLGDVLGLVADFRATDAATPVVLMGYANPIEAMGTTAFADAARAAGVDGVLVVDYPPEESAEFAALLDARGLAPIFLLSPTTPQSRIAAIGAMARGYVYYVSLKGVTGAGHLDTDEVARRLAEIRRHITLPVGVGFGIRDAASAQAIARHADAVVIGSRIIEEIESGAAAAAPGRAGAWLAGIRAALDSAGGRA